MKTKTIFTHVVLTLFVVFMAIVTGCIINDLPPYAKETAYEIYNIACTIWLWMAICMILFKFRRRA